MRSNPYKELRVPPRCTESLLVTSLGTRIQCGGTLSPLPSGRDSVGIGGDVQWNGLTVLYTFWSVDSLLTSELHYGTNHETGCTAHWEFGTIRCQQQDQPVGLWLIVMYEVSALYEIAWCTRMK